MIQPVETVYATARLAVRRLVPGADDAFILRLLNEPSFIANIADRGVRTLEAARAYIENGPVAMYAKHGFGLWCVTLPDGTPLGMCGLIKRDHMDDVDVGYAFLPEHWGRGYALEAVAGSLAWGRAHRGLGRIVAIVNPDNARSIRVLQKLDFRYEGPIRMPGEETDIALYASSAPGTAP